MKHASHSNWPTAKPLAAPLPASPMKCSAEMFDANRLAPMAIQPMLPPPRK
ncbi:MAG: hypothetical protein BWY59_00926 [Verrucomicrobia bacterium ADurb.Bin345]|nr:MAG: hypothetical protein BWY59_00926 [Verrucomicrobia bacterium ADurb.Bin345]